MKIPMAPVSCQAAGIGMTAKVNGPLRGFESAFRFRGPSEVVCGHGPKELNVDPPFPLLYQVLDHPLHFAFLVGGHEERDIDRVELMRWLSHNAGDTNPLHGLLQGPRVFLPHGGDLTGNRRLDVAALDNELCAAFQLLESVSELIVMGREQLLDDRILTGEDRAEGQGYDGHLEDGRVQDFPVGAEIIR